MVRLQIISGKMAGTEKVARRFPFTIGRSVECGLVLEDGGVWDTHCAILAERGRGIVLRPMQDAIVAINATAAGESVLRNGDTLDIGGAKIRFWLSDTTPQAFRWREWLTWAGFAFVLAVQFFLIYRLGR